LVPGAAKSLAVALEFVPALGAIADPPTLGFALDRPLADQAAGPVKVLKAARTAERIARVLGRALELESAARIAAAMA
jgi:hypothetical protein